MIDWDSSELNMLAADLGRVPGRIVNQTTKVVFRGAVNIRDSARKLAPGSRYARHYPNSITYDVDAFGRPGVIEAEIGPDRNRRQGALGVLFEHGSVNNPPMAHMGPSLDLEGPKFVRNLADAAEDAFE